MRVKGIVHPVGTNGLDLQIFNDETQYYFLMYVMLHFSHHNSRLVIMLQVHFCGGFPRKGCVFLLPR
jgi:hypothetical protein